MKLTNRLKKISELIPDGSTVADVGTDHAYLPTYCLLKGKIRSAVAMDVNEGPLASAAENTAKYGVSALVDLRLSDGIEKLKYGETDVIVIAGMGGLLIKRILESGRDKIADGTLLLLQPMIAQEELRKYLYSSSLGIENEYLAREGGKIYNIIAARAGQNALFGEYDILVGKNLKENSPKIYHDYLSKRIKTLKKIVKGIEKSADKTGLFAARHVLETYSKELYEK